MTMQKKPLEKHDGRDPRCRWLCDSYFNWSGRRVGVDVNQNFHSGRKWFKLDGSVNQAQNFLYFFICKILLCRENRIFRVAGRMTACLKEHMNFVETYIWREDFTPGKKNPMDKAINSHPIRSSNKREKRWWLCLCQLFVLIFCYY